MKKHFACCFALVMMMSAGMSLTAASGLEVHGIKLDNLGLRPPRPQLIFADPVGDLMPLPPDWKVENRAVMDIVGCEAKSNGLVTLVVLKFSPKSDINRIQGTIFVDTDENTRTGFNPGFSIGGSLHRVELGVDAEISLWDFPRSRTAMVTVLSGSFDRTAIAVHMEGQELRIAVPNAALGTVGRGEARIFTAFADEFGLQDIGPNQGVGQITSTSRLRISPGSSVLVRDLSRDPRFLLTAIIEQDSPGLDVTRFWLENGNDLTSRVEAGLAKALLLPGKEGRPGQTFGYSYPVNSLFPGRHEITVIGISADALMTDTVVYEVVEQVSAPPMPAPPPRQ